jgi:hypothetical protein
LVYRDLHTKRTSTNASKTVNTAGVWNWETEMRAISISLYTGMII